MSVYAFTSVTVNYIPKARVLAQSLRRLHPEIKFVLVLAEAPPPGMQPDLDYFDDIVTIADFPGPSRPSWLFQHSLVETCTALKGFFVEKVFEWPDCESVLYFDPDIVVFHRVDGILELLQKHPIVLTPHQVDPEFASDAVMDNEICSLKHGVYNLGFLAVSNTVVGRDFARWWRERLDRHCFDDIPNGLFTDQRWGDLVPALFDGVHILRDRTYNVATWNIAYRRIEGTVDTGILADGQPLKFFHFSGFDSGAQLTMLRGYGGSMPAAFALRAWYIDQCAKLDPENHFAQPWPYDTFADGEPITRAHRRTYRDRMDLQQAFPDPFAADDATPSFRRWYEDSFDTGSGGEPAPRAWGSAAVQDNPLAHFLVEGAAASLDPHPLFSTGYYLDCNPDVGSAGENPLVHFVTSGEAEGRDPHPDFQTRFYLEERPDVATSGLGPTAHYWEVGRVEGSRPSPLFNSIRDGRLLEETADYLQNGKPTLLFVSHYSGGGTGRHVRDLVGRYRHRANFVVLEPTHRGTLSARVHVSGHESPTLFEFDTLGRMHQLVDAVRRFEPCRIHIHHLLGNEDYLRNLLGILDIPFDYTVHDYYAFSPEPHLAGAGGHFVGGLGSDTERELFEYGIGPGTTGTTGPTSLAAWQATHRWMIDRADRVIAPSLDVKLRLRHFGVTRKIVFAPHPDAPYRREEVSPKTLGDGEPLRVLILGELSLRKGLLLVQDCAIAAERRRLPIEFHLVGFLAVGIRQAAHDNLQVHGRYREDEVEDLVRAVDPHLAWFPMTSLETYCYTLSTALTLELPILSTDLGPFPERLQGRPWTWLEPWDSPCDRWLDLFTEIAGRLSGRAAPGGSGAAATNSAAAAINVPLADGGQNGSAAFYDRDYLAPALAAFRPDHGGVQARR